MKIALILLILSFISFNLAAKEQNLITVTNDDPSDKEISYIVLETDDDKNDIQKIFKDIHREDGTKKSRVELKLQSLLNGGEVVLEKRSDRDVVKLSTESFCAHNGGFTKISFLYSGITGKWKSEELEFARAGQNWEVLSEGRPITKMHFLMNNLMRKTIGIKEMQVK